MDGLTKEVSSCAAGNRQAVFAYPATMSSSVIPSALVTIMYTSPDRPDGTWQAPFVMGWNVGLPVSMKAQFLAFGTEPGAARTRDWPAWMPAPPPWSAIAGKPWMFRFEPLRARSDERRREGEDGARTEGGVESVGHCHGLCG